MHAACLKGMLWYLLLGVFSCQAAGLAEVIAQLKPSIVAIGTLERTRSPQFRFLGTGFVVGDGTIVATNAHVLPETLDTAKMETLIAVPFVGKQKQDPRVIKKLRIDARHDIALVRVSGAPLKALHLGDSARVREGDGVSFIGYPIAHALGLFPVTHRGMISSITPISIPLPSSHQLDAHTIKTLKADPFEIFQLDATAYPGNSGSPLFDPDNGEVLGIVNMVFVKGTKETILSEPSGISYAIPVEYLKKLIEQADE